MLVVLFMTKIFWLKISILKDQRQECSSILDCALQGTQFFTLFHAQKYLPLLACLVQNCNVQSHYAILIIICELQRSFAIKALENYIKCSLLCNFSISDNGTLLDSKQNSYPVKAVLMRIFQLSIASHRNFCCWVFGRLLSHCTFLQYMKKQVSICL